MTVGFTSIDSRCHGVCLNPAGFIHICVRRELGLRHHCKLSSVLVYLCCLHQGKTNLQGEEPALSGHGS